MTWGPDKQFVTIIPIKDLSDCINNNIHYAIEYGYVKEYEYEQFFDWCVEEAVELILNVKVKNHWYYDYMANLSYGREDYKTAYNAIIRNESVANLTELFIKTRCDFMKKCFNGGETVKLMVTYNDLFIARTQYG